MLRVGLGFKETRRIFSRWKLLQEKVITALHGVSTSHPVAQTLHTLKCDIVPPLLQPALSICSLPCPSSWPAGIQVMNAQHSGLGMLLPLQPEVARLPLFHHRFYQYGQKFYLVTVILVRSVMPTLLTHLLVVLHCKKLGWGYRCGRNRCRETSSGIAKLVFVFNCQIFFSF